MAKITLDELMARARETCRESVLSRRQSQEAQGNARKTQAESRALIEYARRQTAARRAARPEAEALGLGT